MNVKLLIRVLIFSVLILPTLPAWADITVVLKAPKWEFLLDNQPWAASQAELAAGESSFARAIQPLLAAQDHEAVIEAFGKRNIKTDSAALRLLRGQALLSLNRPKEAEKALQAALQSMPKLALAHRSLSMVYMLEKQYKKARKHLAYSIELVVADAQVYGQLAFVNLQLGQAASALAGYQYALFLNPENKQWQQGLLYALIQSQAFDQAQSLVEELLQDEPDNADLWLQRGQIALKQVRFQQALASMEKALQLGVNDADNIATIAQLHIQSGSPRRAVDLLSGNISTLIAGNKVDVLDQIAAWLVYQESWRQLANLVRSVTKGEVKLSSRYQSRFFVYQAQVALAGNKSSGKHLISARKYLRQAIDSDPANGDALLTLATLLRDQNQSERAVLYYIRAEGLSSFKERAFLGRAQLEIDRQNYSEALRLLRLVVQGNPTRSDVLANIKSLENLMRLQG